MKFDWHIHNVQKNKIDLPKDFLRVMNKLNTEDDHIIEDITFYSYPLFEGYDTHKHYELKLYMKDENADYQYHHYYTLFLKTCKVLQMDAHYHINKITFHIPK